MGELLPVDSLPRGWFYPPEFVRDVELGLTDLEPWQVLLGEPLFARHQGLRSRYRPRRLVPFAARQDNDDVACWELSVSAAGVVVVHDLASRGWEHRGTFTSFNDWLRAAVEDLIAFEPPYH